MTKNWETPGVSARRGSWDDVVAVWATHFERMESDPDYAEWVDGGEIGPCPPRRIEGNRWP